MASGPDPVRLAGVVGRVLGPGLRVEGLRRVSGGASRETWLFDAVGPDADTHRLLLRRGPGGARGPGAPGAAPPGLVRRGDRGGPGGQPAGATESPPPPAPPAAGAAGPRPLLPLETTDGLGPGFVRGRMGGETTPRRILRDDEYAAAR